MTQNDNQPLLIVSLILIFFPLFIEPLIANPIDGDNICHHIKILASDEFEGRGTGTKGELKTIEYLAAQFEEIGLSKPFDNSYFQKVDLATFNVIPPSKVNVDFESSASIQLEHKKDFLISSTYASESINIESTELVFAGFGIHAPELGWDDYKDIDVNGKVVLVLSDVPAEYTEEDDFWKGDPAAQIYGKSFYKKNEAASRGAIGLITIFKKSKQALYTWESIANYIGVNDQAIKIPRHEKQLKFSAVLSKPAAETLLESVGYSESELIDMALQSSFKPLPLNCQISFNFSNTWSDLTTHNVIGMIEGTDLKDEVMVYSAHWDHVGLLPGATGDNIRNGAVDNASGAAALIELARAYKNNGPTRRSVLFIATAAEEIGLLGSVWYNRYPLFPPGKTAANFNMDSHYPYGRSTHITGVVYGRSDLDKYLEESAHRQGRTLVSNDPQNIAADIFFRSDHFPFVEQGIPSEFAVGFGEAVGHDNEVFQQKLAAYQYKYHQVTDEYEDDFDCSGIAEDAEFIYEAGRLMDLEGHFPMWNNGQAFKTPRQISRFESKYFKDVSADCLSSIATQGRTMDAHTLDIDGDGDLDIVIAGEYSLNMLLMNDGNACFVHDEAKSLSMNRYDTEDIESSDFNGDGYPDLILVSEDNMVNEYFLGQPDGTLVDVSLRLPVLGKSNAVALLDLNDDGVDDLLIGNDGTNYCLIADGKGHWELSLDRIPVSQKTTQDIELGDIDNDGDIDIICANEDDNEVWINIGDGYFTLDNSRLGGMVTGKYESREAELGDIDGDGDLDLIFANVNFRQNKNMQNLLYLNDGKGFFKDVSSSNLPAENMHSVDAEMIDLDNDGDLDLITANAFGSGFEAYLNDGQGRFTNETKNIIPASVRADGIDIEAADFNKDGCLDLYLSNFRGSDYLLLGKIKNI